MDYKSCKCTNAPSVPLHQVYQCTKCTNAPSIPMHQMYYCTKCTNAPIIPTGGVHSETNTLRSSAARFARPQAFGLRPEAWRRCASSQCNHVNMLTMLQTNLIVLLLQRVPGMHIIPVFYDRGLWTLNPVRLYHPFDCQCCRFNMIYVLSDSIHYL